MAFQLAPRQRATILALGEALFGHPGGPSRTQLETLADRIEAHLAPVSRMQRGLLLLAIEWLRWLPVILFLSARPFEDTALEKRVRLLERMDRSSATLLLIPLVAFKTLLAMNYFEDPTELAALGYPGDDVRKRWKLKVAA